MARYAEITTSNNRVINVILLNQASDYPGSNTIVESNTAQIGDLWTPPSTFVSPAPPKPTPDWSGYATAINANAAYNSFFNSFLGGILATATNLRSLGRYDNYLDLLSTKGDDPRMWTTFIARWNALVLIPLITLPSAANITTWNTIAATYFMPFTFLSTAQMQLI